MCAVIDYFFFRKKLNKINPEHSTNYDIILLTDNFCNKCLFLVHVRYFNQANNLFLNL